MQKVHIDLLKPLSKALVKVDSGECINEKARLSKRFDFVKIG
jgi:hypothetical protein